MKACVVLLTVALWLLLPVTARADPSNPPRSPLGIDVDAQLGGRGGEHTSGFTGGASGRLRWRVLSFGAAVSGTTELVESVFSASGLGGVSVPFELVRVDVLGEVGVNRYSNVGAGWLLSDDPGVDGSVPYVGGRTAVSIRLAETAAGVTLWLGIAGQLTADLERRTVHYSYTEGNWLFDDGGERDVINASQELGQRSYAVTGQFSVSFPL